MQAAINVHLHTGFTTTRFHSILIIKRSKIFLKAGSIILSEKEQEKSLLLHLKIRTHHDPKIHVFHSYHMSS